MQGVGYFVESISRIKILGRLSWSSCLALQSVEGESLFNPTVDKHFWIIKVHREKALKENEISRRKTRFERK